MSSPRIGSLFSGYGGLDMGVMAALGGSVAWHVEFEKAPSKILAHHWPEVPNYGDVTAVDWSAVEPVDILTGGSPCQDLSHAGKRAGMTEGTRSNLWVAMREAIAQLRPSIVVWENVRGAYSAPAISEVERESGLLGVRRGEPALRALGRVLGDLSSLGYDARWHGLRASDIGAPHERFRVFVAATNTRHNPADHLPGRMGGQQGTQRREGAAVHGSLVRRGAVATPGTEGSRLDEWGDIGPALVRWERITGHPAPSLHEPYAVIAEFAMGLERGHVTDVPGLPEGAQLKALGNGVVPQQAAAALRFLLGAREVAA